MKNLIREVHRRSLWQVLGIYLGASWLVLQIVDTMAGALSLPDWAASLAFFLLVVGLPIVLATAFVQEGMTTKDPEPPRQSLADVGEIPPEPAPEATGHRRWLTWRNALLGGGAALALVGLLSTGWLVSRALGIGPAATLVAQGVIEERAPILVADFEGSDQELAHTATDALRIDLSQSRVVSVVEPTEVGQVLRRMERQPDEPLTLDLAREVAVREGIPVVVAGGVDRAGDAYVVSARLIRSESGEVLASDRERARNATAVLDAIDDLSRALRERLGESLRLMNREEPLERVTTGSLDALRKYSQALRAHDLAGDDDRAIALLDEAVREDPQFAMAWRKLGTVLGNRFVERERSVEALSQAFAHRDRLPDRERYQVEGIYKYSVLVDIPGAITAYENLLDIDPEDDYALNNLGVLYGYLREHERSREYYERAIAIDSSSSLAYTNAMTMRLALGRYEEAREMMALFRDKFPENPSRLQYSSLLASATGQWDEANDWARQLVSEASGNPFWMGTAIQDLAAVAAIRGRLAETRRLRTENMSNAARGGAAVPYLNQAAALAMIEVGMVGDRARALEILDEALRRFPLDSLPAMDRPYPLFAIAYAWAGQAETARELLSAFETNVPSELRSWITRSQYEVARGEIALAAGRYGEALDHARRAQVGFCRPCDAQLIARIHDAAGVRDSAIAAYKRYREIDWHARSQLFDERILGPFLERLARLLDERGDLDEASRYYAEFVQLWAEADPELQPRVRAAQTRLEQILSEIG